MKYTGKCREYVDDIILMMMIVRNFVIKAFDSSKYFYTYYLQNLTKKDY